jgi:hypothetical protein
VIWPPNNKMVTVNAAITASSPNGHPTAVELVSITSSEPGGDDIQGAAFGTVTYRATDTVTGLSTTVTATVAPARSR